MKIKGNYYILFIGQIISGIITYFACVQFDLWGVLIGITPFLIAMFAVQIGYKPDEREIEILHKSNSYEGMIIASIMTIVYIFIPSANWFYIFAASISIVRGVVGIVLSKLI